jgi:hypothetical protein
MRGLAFDQGKTLFGTTTSAANQLWTIDITTGEATAIGPLEINTVSALTFDASGTLFGSDEFNLLTGYSAYCSARFRPADQKVRLRRIDEALLQVAQSVKLQIEPDILPSSL